MMYDAFNNLSVETLIDLIGFSYLKEARKIATNFNTDDKQLLIDCLYAKYLDNPCKESFIRKALFETLSNDCLSELAEKYCKKHFNTKESNALALSTIPWKITSSNFIAEMLLCINISKNDLPNALEKRPSHKLIEPVDDLPRLFDYQQELIDLIKQAIKTEKRFLIQLPTGAGKTRILMEALVAYINKTEALSNGNNILWLAHSEELCEQALDTCENVWTHKGASSLFIARLWGTYKHYSLDLHESFIFGSLQKLVSLQKKDDEIFRHIKKHLVIVVIDEAHKALAPTYKKLIENLSENAVIIGATATPGRNTDEQENMKLAKLFNQHLLTASFPGNAITCLKEKGILSTLNIEFINTDLKISLNNSEYNNDDFNLESSRRIISLLAKNKNRNKLIIETVIDEVENGAPCIIFSCSVEHSLTLAGAFALSGKRARHIDCNMHKGDRRKTIEAFKKGEYDILINYGVLSTGFDSPRIKTVVITRPTTSIILYSQMIGRGLRGPAIGGGDACKIIDIKDNFVNYGEVEKVYGFFDQYWK